MVSFTVHSLEGAVPVTLEELTRGVTRSWSDFAPMRVTFQGEPAGWVNPETGHWCRDELPARLFTEWRTAALCATSPYSWAWAEVNAHGERQGEYAGVPTREAAFEAVAFLPSSGMIARTREGQTEYKWGAGDIWASSEAAAAALVLTDSGTDIAGDPAYRRDVPSVCAVFDVTLNDGVTHRLVRIGDTACEAVVLAWAAAHIHAAADGLEVVSVESVAD